MKANSKIQKESTKEEESTPGRIRINSISNNTNRTAIKKKYLPNNEDIFKLSNPDSKGDNIS